MDKTEKIHYQILALWFKENYKEKCKIINENVIMHEKAIVVDYPSDEGVWIFYMDGVTRFIAYSWWDDINTDDL